MRVSMNWLKSLLPGLDLSDAPARLTALGLEVEGVEVLAERLAGVVVAEVVEVKPHPKADKLKLATVSDGATEHTVVCGAPNVAQGQKAALAPLGVTLPNGLTMEPRTIRGVASEGMLCAEDELELSDDHEGILVLSADAVPGTPLAEALGLDDVVLELGLTPNRADALSHLGVARELAAAAGAPLPTVEVELAEAEPAASTLASAHVDDAQGCSRYLGRVLTGVRIGPSPRWVQDRLRSLGQRPISNVVDATNLVLLELGQPMHAFDLDRLAGARVQARRAAEGESIALLDGSTRTLSADDLVIADGDGPVALAGVMGGADSEVTAGEGERPATTRILLESARFSPSVVRRSSKRHGLHTESSHRFERGTDPAGVQRALDRCAALIVAWAGGTIHAGRLEAGPGAPPAPPIPIRAERASMLLGVPVDAATVAERLGRLGLVEAEAPAGAEPGRRWFVPPPWRMDLEIEADLIEEVGRLGGYNDIPAVLPAGARAPSAGTRALDPEDEARDALVAEGWLETISLAFGSPGRSDGFTAAEPVRLANPLGEESRWMRVSLLPALLEAVHHNQVQLPSITDLRLFEIGRAFAWGSSPADLPRENDRIAVLLRGRAHPTRWFGEAPVADVYDLLGALEGLFDRFHLRPALEPTERPFLHPKSASVVRAGEQALGVLGELHPDVAARFDLEGPPVFVAELDLGCLAAARGAPPRHRPLPRMPPAQRDLAFFVDEGLEAQRLIDTVRRAAPPELERVAVFDVYRGRGVPAGKKSVALGLSFRAGDRTLADAEVAEATRRMVEAAKVELGATLRDADSGG